MSFYYIFQNGKIILKENGAIPEATDAGKFRKNFLNSGCVDKKDNAACAADASAGLPPNEITEVRQGGGAAHGFNIIRVERGRIAVVSADCPDGACVRRGWISHAGGGAVCLPHRLVVRIKGAGGGVDGVSW